LEPESSTGQSVFLHYEEILPRVSREDFDQLKGCIFSFIIEKAEKGPAAKRARLVAGDDDLIHL
jgi:hypothetical protein